LHYENRAKSSRFRDSANKDKEKHHINFMDEEADDEEGNEICIAEWVENPGDKPIMCSFLKPNGGQREEVIYTFDVSKCDHLFDLLLQGGVIPSTDILAKKTYCKWHDSYTHTTNECNYFWRQVQSAINDGRLMLGGGGKMKLDMDLFPIGMVKLEHKKILVRTDQAETTKSKNVVVFDDLRNRMIKPHNPEIDVWKENVQRKMAKRVKPTSAMLIEKYQRQLEEDQRHRVARGIKWDRFFEAQNRSNLQETQRGGEPRRRMVQHSIDRELGIRQNPRFTDRSSSGNPDRHVNHPDVCVMKKNGHAKCHSRFILMDDALVSQFVMRRTRREHVWCCLRVATWLGWATRDWQVLLQRSRTRGEIRVTLVRLTELARWSSTTRV
jgi:hypothetical protein